ncbi:germination protein YpeB [Sporolactobacillus sp. THM7-7]|nr:germination protein YpeB [Sporolactobacillus sp. THM7-7]
MKRHHWFIPVLIFAAVMIGLGIRLYLEQREKEAVMTLTENHYQKAYHELTYYVDMLEESLGMSLAMKERNDMRPQLAEAWRLSALALDEANDLPLTLLPFNRTNEYLSHVGSFAYNTGVRITDNRPLSSEEYRNLENLYNESKQIRDGLRDVERKVMADHLRWMDVGTALEGQKQNQDNQVIDGLKRVDGQATAYTQGFSPENPQNSALEKKKLKPLSGPNLSQNEAAAKLKKWLGKPDADIQNISRTGKGASIDAFKIALKNGQRTPINALVTRKGGHIVWFMRDRSFGKRRLGLYEASKRADQFMKLRGPSGMARIRQQQFGTVGVFTYTQNRQNVRVYPASIRLKVALDNGEVIAYNASDYLFNRCDNVPHKPKLTEQAAKKLLNPNLNIKETRLAVFQNPLRKSILCYEVFATKGQETYRVLINANTGNQEKIELLRS